MKPRRPGGRRRPGGDGDRDETRRSGLVLSRGRRHAHVALDGDVAPVRCDYDPSLFDPEADTAHPVAAGDRVDVAIGRRGARVVSVDERRGYLSRRRGGKEQVIVANVDRVLIVGSAASPRFRPRLVDRMIVAAERARFEPVIVVNKIDLADDRAPFEETRALYAGLGYRAILACATTGEGVDELRDVVKAGVTAATGPSGVGKTTLLNAVEPGLAEATAPISKRWGKGVHTTTRVTLHRLSDGGFYADTPGVRTFDVAGLKPEDVALFFREFAPFIDACRFNSCTHDHEPECAVKEAVAKGAATERRYESYLRILRGDDDAGFEDETLDDASDDDGEEA
jgi:ribosome biogenesis GTPase / thiamine phosphate phosphatase